MSRDRGWRESVGSAAFEGLQPGCDDDRCGEALCRPVAVRIRGCRGTDTDDPQERMQDVRGFSRADVLDGSRTSGETPRRVLVPRLMLGRQEGMR